MGEQREERVGFIVGVGDEARVLSWERAGAGESLVVLVNRGWVPETRKDPARRPEGQVAGAVTVELLA